MPFISASAISPYNSIRGGAAESLDPILAFNPFNVWDSEHVVVDGTTTTFTDFNNVGTAYDLTNPAATNQPTYNSSDSNFNNLPSISFDGIDNYASGTAPSYRNSDTSGVFVSVYRKPGASTRINPFIVSDTVTSNYIGYSIVQTGTYRFIALTSGSKVRSWRGSTNINNTTTSYVVANANTGSEYKQWINETPQTITMISGANDGTVWLNDEIGGFDTLSFGALVRIGAPINFAPLDWVFSGYFPYTSYSEVENIITYLKTNYALDLLL